MKTTSSTMKTLSRKILTLLSALAIGAVLVLAFAAPVHAGKACSASLNLKTCVSSLDSVSFDGTTLTLTGVLRALNSGGTPGSILSVVANLQTKDKSDQYATIATATAPCGAGDLVLDQTLPLSVPGGPVVCGGGNEADIGFTATFSDPGLGLVSGKPARLELQVTYDGAPTGTAGEFCGATPACGTRVINVRFGFVVP